MGRTRLFLRMALATLLLAGAVQAATGPSAAVEGGDQMPHRFGTGTAQIWHDGLGYDAFICSGSVVGPTKILTAEHCMDPQFLDDYFVYVGSTKRGEGHKLRVGNVGTRFDLAVLTLTSNMSNLTGVERVQIRQYQISPQFGSYMHAYGYGRTCRTCDFAQVLKRAELRLLDEGTDARNGPGYRMRGVGAKLWRRDSGGPVFMKGDTRVQHAVTSWSPDPDKLEFYFARFDTENMNWLKTMNVPVETGW